MVNPTPPPVSELDRPMALRLARIFQAFYPLQWQDFKECYDYIFNNPQYPEGLN